MKFPKISQWKQIFKVLKGAESKIFLVLVFLAILTGTYLAIVFYLNNTKLAPTYGGTYVEGIVGQPRFINPIYGETNDIDRALIGLIYSGLMTYDKDGKIINDLVESYEMSDDEKTYNFRLKDNLYWQDGVPLTADDVVYTIKTIQNSDYKSPLRANWLNVEIKKTSEKSFTMALGSPYNSFLENCTIKIIPQHIWKDIPAENFVLSPYNLQPIGSGPYMLSSIEETNSFIKNIILSSNHKYHEKAPYISKIYFLFFNNQEDLIAAANQKNIQGFSISNLNNSQASAEKKIRQGWTSNEKFNFYSFAMPRYFAVFFNNNPPAGAPKILSDVGIRQAMIYSVNKQEILQKISEVFKEKVSAVNSPILPEYFNYSVPTINYDFDLDLANKLLDKSGYLTQENGTRAKPNTKKPAFQFTNYLKIGSSGTQVTELQNCLAKLDDDFKNLLEGETSGQYGKGTGDAVTAFQKKHLPDIQSTAEVGPGTRSKLNSLCFATQDNSTPLQIALTTINQPQLIATAEFLKDYWERVGITLNINAIELSDLKEVIKNRRYDALLYGQALGSLPDLYPFWHSTQINDPGLNLSIYQNKKADQLLKDSRETSSPEIKGQKYESLQDIILEDAPALFLYNPDYLYWVSAKIKGIDTTKIVDPAKRFSNIINWHINTKRVWK